MPQGLRTLNYGFACFQYPAILSEKTEKGRRVSTMFSPSSSRPSPRRTQGVSRCSSVCLGRPGTRSLQGSFSSLWWWNSGHVSSPVPRASSFSVVQDLWLVGHLSSEFCGHAFPLPGPLRCQAVGVCPKLTQTRRTRRGHG